MFHPKTVVSGAVSPYKLLRMVEEYIPKEYAENYNASGHCHTKTWPGGTHIIDEPDQADDKEAPAVHLE